MNLIKKITNRFVTVDLMSLIKNSNKWISFSVTAILLISISFISIHNSLSIFDKQNSVFLSNEFSPEQENTDSEKEFEEDSSILFYLDIQNLNFKKNFERLPKKQYSFLVPQVFYDIQILPPELQVS